MEYIVAELAAAGMEGGSPTLIWERWTLPMYAAQQRYWGDHPRLEDLFIAASFKKFPHRYTPPPRKRRVGASPSIDPSLWDAPLSDAERGIVKGPLISINR